MALTTAQRRRALVKANDVRYAVAALRRDLNHGLPPHPHLSEVGERIQVATDLLVNRTDTIAHLKVHAFLELIPRVGEDRVRRILTRLKIWPLRRIGQLTDRQRRAIAFELERLAGIERSAAA